MRPGLVAVGIVFLLVGAGVIATVLYAPDAPTVERSHTIVVNGLLPGIYRLFTVPADAKPSADLSLDWTASGPVDVTWYLTSSCNAPSGWCIDPVPAAAWSGNVSGAWSYSGSAVSLYALRVQDATNVSVNFTSSFAEQYHPNLLPLEPWPLAVVLGGGSLLVGTGAVVLYLGLFLPTGTFSPLASGPPFGDVPEPDGPTAPADPSPRAPGRP